MSKFIVKGNRALSGQIRISGSKNAALPIIFASLITRGETVITSVPDIRDVRIAIDIIRILGARVHFSSGVLFVDTQNLSYREIPRGLVSSLRASTYLIGATLSRFGKADLYETGGCNFDTRPIDMHVRAASSFGARQEGQTLVAKRLIGADIHFDKISVGATVNAIIMAASAEGKSRIFGYAREPHVISLIDYLVSSGGKISLTDDCIEIEGRTLEGACLRVIPDMIEAGTYIALSLMGENKISVVGADFSHLESYIKALCLGGAVFEHSSDSIKPISPINRQISIKTAPYPHFPTDLQPVMAPLLALAEGGIIEEGVWHNRFGYLKELSEFGIISSIGDGRAEIYKSAPKSAIATVPDLRGGAAMLLSALMAEGESCILGADVIKRGYEDVCRKLRGVGAQIIEET